MTDAPTPLPEPGTLWGLPDGRPHPEFYKYMLALDRALRKTVDFSNIPETPFPTDLRDMYMVGAASDETVALTTGTQKLTFRMPCAMTGQMVRANLKTAQTSGSVFTVDINKNGTSILSTKLTIDNTERTSVTASAAAVISDDDWSDDAEFTVDIDQVGDGTAVGLKIMMFGARPAP